MRKGMEKVLQLWNSVGIFSWGDVSGGNGELC